MPARARADRSTRSVFVSSLSMVPSEAGNTSSDGDASIAAATCGRRAGATGMTSACPPFVVSRAYERRTGRPLDEIDVGLPKAAQLPLAHAVKTAAAKNARHWSGTSPRTTETGWAESVGARAEPARWKRVTWPAQPVALLFIRSRLLRLNERDKPADDPKQESHLLTL